MPVKGVSMRKLKELVRLSIDARLSIRKIARSLSLSVGVVSKYVNRLKSLDLSDEALLHMDEGALAELLKCQPRLPTGAQPPRPVDLIDFAYIHQEMKRKCVTMQLLWEEYSQDNPHALSYSRFCFHYRQWKVKQPRSMRQTHKAGDKVFVDYSGQTVDVIDP